jgi:glucose/arabinose dehydrogenase
VDPIPEKIPTSSVNVRLNSVATGLSSPVFLTDAGDNSGRLFVVDQVGQVRIIRNGQLQSGAFLDVSSQLVNLTPEYDERGLLGLAFDPDFKTSGKVYTYYTTPVTKTADLPDPFLNGAAPDHQGVVSEWRVDPNNPDRIDPASRRELFRWDHPNTNHNGGQLMFGPDRMLYLSVGDGGGADDQNGQIADGGEVTRGKAPEGNGQNTTVPLGKILRIDPRGTSSANGQYAVPADNPFAGQSGKVREIYAYGLRNPYRFSFDKANGRLVVNDVGQISVEEIDIIQKGGNYGWHVKEGTFTFDPLGTAADQQGVVTANSPGLPAGLIDPVAEYDHDEGEASVGGFVYRGTKIPELVGKYVFGDFAKDEDEPSGQLFAADLATGRIERLRTNLGNPLSEYVKGLGQGADGELYLLTSSAAGPAGDGTVYAITAANVTVVPLPAAAASGAVGLAGVWLGCARGTARRRRV